MTTQTRLLEVIEAVVARRGKEAAVRLFDATIVVDVVGGLIAETRRLNPCESREACIRDMNESMSRLLDRLGICSKELGAALRAHSADIDEIDQFGRRADKS